MLMWKFQKDLQARSNFKISVAVKKTFEGHVTFERFLPKRETYYNFYF